MVERYAASVPATTRPRKPAGRKRIIAGYATSLPISDASTYGNATAMSCSVGNTSVDASAVRIHGHGRSA